jgi:hypothetical protein
VLQLFGLVDSDSKTGVSEVKTWDEYEATTRTKWASNEAENEPFRFAVWAAVERFRAACELVQIRGDWSEDKTPQSMADLIVGSSIDREKKTIDIVVKPWPKRRVTFGQYHFSTTSTLELLHRFSNAIDTAFSYGRLKALKTNDLSGRSVADIKKMFQAAWKEIGAVTLAIDDGTWKPGVFARDALMLSESFFTDAEVAHLSRFDDVIESLKTQADKRLLRALLSFADGGTAEEVYDADPNAWRKEPSEPNAFCERLRLLQKQLPSNRLTMKLSKSGQGSFAWARKK